MKLKFKKYGFLLLLSTVIGEYSYAQTRSYLQTEVVRVAGQFTNNDVNNLTSANKSTVRTYFDGSGRPLQKVMVQASTAQKDIIQPVSYDNLGRQTTQYLPYTNGTTDGSYHTSAISEEAAYYNNGLADKVADDGSPFSQQVFENSPLQRLLRSGSVGVNFQPVNGQHFKTAGYSPNTGNEQVVIWNTDGTSGGSFYGANTLWITDAKDEMGAETLTFKDLDGRTILKRQVKGTINLDTYYIYNAAGVISYVVPPKAVAVMKGSSWNLSLANVNVLLFKYVYDNYARPVEKTVPGADVTYLIYDPLNRPVLIQDGNMRVSNQWNYIKYDTKNRPVSQGIYQDKTNIGRINMQAYVAGLTGYNTVWDESRTSATPYYSNNVFPTTNYDGTALQDLAYSYFDDYDLNADGNPDYSYQAQITGEATPTTALRGMPTIVRKRTVGTGLSNIWLTKVMFYDNRYRVIQTQGNNQLNTAVNDISTSVPNFIGQPTVTKIVKVTGAITTTVQTAYSYDVLNRLVALDQSYNGAAALRVAAYEYNEMGQLVKKNLNSLNGGSTVPASVTLDGTTTFPNNKLTVIANSVTINPGFATPANSTVIIKAATTSYLQALDYRYNIRGQLLSMNNSTLANDGVKNSDSNDLFGMEILYDQQDASLPNVPKFNGLASAVKWMSKDASNNNSNERSYIYTYDQVKQLTGSSYAERAPGGSGSFSLYAGAFDETGITYDENGNIGALKRNAMQNNKSIVPVDDLTYTYDPSNLNQLKTVGDASGANANGFGFKNLTNTTSGNYVYDTNGNMKQDPYKGLSIDYNILNRTDKITIAVTGNSGRYLTYTYDATGTLLRKQQYDNSALKTTTDYSDGFVFTTVGTGSPALSYFGMPEGRVRNNSGTLKAEYIIADQQGNARVSFEDNGSGTAIVRQQNSYYSFGLSMPDNLVTTPSVPNQNLYNGGAEWQNDYGDLPDLQQTFYRNYDAALGRWTAVDPIAESAESLSIYHYAGNNPVMMNDPMGDISQEQWQFVLQQVNGTTGNYNVQNGADVPYTTLSAADGFTAGANYISQFNAWGLNGSPGGYQQAARAFNMDQAGNGSHVDELNMARYITGSTEWFHQLNGAAATQGGVSASIILIDLGDNKQTTADKGVTRDQYLSIWGFETSAFENFAGKTQLGNWKLYYENPATGRVFTGNQWVKTIGLAKTAKIFGIAGAVVGVGFDFKGYVKYRDDPYAEGAVSGSKFGTDTFMGGFGLTGFGTIPSLLYFGIDAYAPGVMGDLMLDMQKENEQNKNELLWHLH